MASNFSAVWVIFVLSLVAVPCFATVYTVGDSAGWSLGVDYATWAAAQTFVVGDSLVFNYGGSHTVDEVSPTDYSSCSAANAITSDNTGATTITLKTAGVHNFICGVMGHCGSGMKLSVNVSSGTTSPSGTPPSTPSVISPPSDTTSPTDGSGSGTGSVGGSVLVGVVAMVVGYMVVGF